jgi:hypothetical protein
MILVPMYVADFEIVLLHYILTPEYVSIMSYIELTTHLKELSKEFSSPTATIFLVLL